MASTKWIREKLDIVGSPRLACGMVHLSPARVRTFRRRRGWTQIEMARQLGVTERTIQWWEKTGVKNKFAALALKGWR
jgi:DNA-binding XRE family transcriptional regulator